MFVKERKRVLLKAPHSICTHFDVWILRLCVFLLFDCLCSSDQIIISPCATVTHFLLLLFNDTDRRDPNARKETSKSVKSINKVL